MSIAQQIMANPGRFSKAELQAALNQGVVPAYIAIPLIEEKTKKEKMMQMAMAGQGAPQEGAPTVAEEVLQQADQGLLGLESNLPEDEYNYAPGGIVAFDHGGPVKHFRVGGLKFDPEDYSDFSGSALLGPDYEATEEGIASLVPYANVNEEQSPSGLVSALQRNYEAIQGIQGKAPSTAEEDKAISAYLSKQAENAAANAERAKGYRFLELAGAIGSSDQAYNPLAAISGGLKQVAPLFAQDEAAREKAGLENLMARRELAQRARDQALSGLPSALQLTNYESDLEAKRATAAANVRRAQIAAGKAHQNEMSQWMDAHVAAERERIANGERKPVSDAILRQEAGLALFKTRQQPQMAAVAQRDVEAAGTLDARLKAIEESGLNRATDAVTAATNNLRTVEGREMKRIGKEQGPAAALQYKNQLIKDLAAGKITLSTPGSAASPQAAASATKAPPTAAPASIPPRAVDYLKSNNNPSNRAAFDAKYGKGAAARALGG